MPVTVDIALIYHSCRITLKVAMEAIVEDWFGPSVVWCGYDIHAARYVKSGLGPVGRCGRCVVIFSNAVDHADIAQSPETIERIRDFIESVDRFDRGREAGGHAG